MAREREERGGSSRRGSSPARDGKALSLRPSDAVQGGGGLLGSNGPEGCTIKSIEAMLYGYPDKAGNPTVDPAAPSAEVIFVRDEDDKEFTEHYGAGDSRAVAPRADGKSFMSLSDKEGVSDSCNLMDFLAAAIDAKAIDEDDLADGDLTVLEGLHVEVERKPQRERNFGDKRAGQKPRTMLVIVGVLDEKKKGGGKGSSASSSAKGGKGKPAPEPEGNEELDEKLREMVTEIVDAQDGEPISKQDLANEINKAARKDEDRKALVARVYEDEFLEAMAGDDLVDFDGDDVRAVEKKSAKGKKR